MHSSVGTKIEEKSKKMVLRGSVVPEKNQTSMKKQKSGSSGKFIPRWEPKMFILSKQDTDILIFVSNHTFVLQQKSRDLMQKYPFGVSVALIHSKTQSVRTL